MRRRKNRNRKIENVTIEAMSSEGLGIVKHNGKVVFVEKSVQGDVADIQTYKRKKRFEIARIDNMHTHSNLRDKPFCKHFNVCGGCKWQHINYEAQIQFKQQAVKDAFQRIGKQEVEKILPIIGADKLRHYRNKVEYTFSRKRWITQEEIDTSGEIEHKQGVGFHVPGIFDKIVDIETCFLQEDISNQIRNKLRVFAQEKNYTFYDQRNHDGLLRNLVVRLTMQNELMLIVIFGKDQEKERSEVLTFLEDEFPEITSLNYIINTKLNDSYADLEPKLYTGKPHIEEKLGDIRFQIRPKSFFQTNSYQAKKLFDVVADFAELTKEDVVYDLYAGVGSIGLYLANKCKQVAGIEIIEQAVYDATENAKINNISNASYFTGDMKLLLNDDFIQQNGKPSVLIIDPPRAGMHKDVVETILKAEIPTLVYVSCNPATQARDVELLSEKYEVVKLQPVDMFPYTPHIENVALLKLKK